MNEKRVRIWLSGLIIAMVSGYILGFFSVKSNGTITIAIIICLIGAISAFMLLRLSRSLGKMWEPYITIIMSLAIFGFLVNAVRYSLLFDQKWTLALQSWFQSSPKM